MEKPISAKLRKKMEFENAVEVWELHDSVLISPYVDINSKYQGVGFYNSYAALGAAAEIPFFTIRNSSTVDHAYCNFDSKDKMNFAYHCFSIGIEFVAPTIISVNNPNTQSRAETFTAELPKHASFVFTLNQDEKVVGTVPILPAGMGNQGGLSEMADVGHSPSPATGQVVQNGWPSIKNRWEFKGPLRIPRNVTIKGSLQFSSIGRAILAGMEAPQGMAVNNDPQPGQLTTVEQAAMIRVSMVGVREVQMRNLQHF